MASGKPSAGESRAGYHRIETFATCPQLYAYKYLLKLRPLREPEGRAAGSLFHIGLMHHYLGRAGRPFRDPFDAMRSAPARIAFTYPKVEHVFRAYLEHYAAEPFKVLDVEREFEISVAGHLHTQRIDLVVEQGGHAIAIDHKTGAGAASSMCREWDMSGQMISMEIVCSAVFPGLYGLPYGGIMINAVRIGTVPEFCRGYVRIEKNLKQPQTEAIAEVNGDIVAEKKAGKDPWQYRRNHGACMGRYGVCEYTTLCRRGRFGLAEYMEAEDEATMVAEGAGAR